MRPQVPPLVAVFVMWAATVSRAADSGPEVAVSGGKIRGSLVSDGGAAFKGIPFAQPPTGELRWREPLPVSTWEGIRDATAFGAPCIQGSGSGSEDCLHLNLWTPEWPPKSRKAVMVWFHGGGNFAGAATDPLFDGESLARHGVVLVTAQYRLGVFGFLAHPELTKESPHHVSGNYGLLDQIAALRWVRDNIAKFGGDPGNVTIFGESAGSLDVNVLMASPFSRGLLRRAIGQSGPVVAPPPLADAEKKGEDLAIKLTTASQPGLKGMRALSSAELQKATGQGLSFLGPTLGVVVDGWVFPESPMKVFAAGKEHRAGLLLGSNARELQRPFFPMTGTLTQAIVEQYGPLADRALSLYGLSGGAEPQPDRSSAPRWPSGPRIRNSVAARLRNWCGTPARAIPHTSSSSHAPRRDGKPLERPTGPRSRTYLELWIARPTPRGTTPLIGRCRPQFRRTGPTSPRPAIPTVAACPIGRSSTPPEGTIWSSPTSGRWPDRACGGRCAICIRRT